MLMGHNGIKMNKGDMKGIEMLRILGCHGMSVRALQMGALICHPSVQSWGKSSGWQNLAPRQWSCRSANMRMQASKHGPFFKDMFFSPHWDPRHKASLIGLSAYRGYFLATQQGLGFMERRIQLQPSHFLVDVETGESRTHNEQLWVEPRHCNAQ